MSENASSLTCRECTENLDPRSDLWKHNCFNGFDPLEYTLVSNNYNQLFPILTTNLTPVADNTSIDGSSCKNNASANTDQDAYDESLIIAVKKRLPLWNHKIPIKDRTTLKKNILWLEVSKEMQVEDVEDVKRRWESLRNKYLKTRKRVIEYVPSGSAASKKKDPSQSFPFYAIMKFLNDVIDSAPMVSSVKNRVDDVANTSINVEEALEEQEPAAPDFYAKKPRKRSVNTKVADFDSEILSCLKENKPLDGVDGFLLQVGEILRDFPVHYRLEVQIELLSLLNQRKKSFI